MTCLGSPQQGSPLGFLPCEGSRLQAKSCLTSAQAVGLEILGDADKTSVLGDFLAL